MAGHIPRVVTDRTLSRAALGIWSIYTLAQTSVGNALVLAQVSVRVRYFFIVAFCLNSLCASESKPPDSPRVQSDLSVNTRSHLLDDMAHQLGLVPLGR